METRSFLLALALLISGIRISTAQVISVNIVGYMNLRVQPGLNLIVNQLAALDEDLNTFLAAPDGSVVFRYSPATQTFAEGITLLAGIGWYPVSGDTNDPIKDIPVGEGFFLQIPGASPITITLVGEVVLDSTNCIPGNYSLNGSVIPQAGTLGDLGFPATDGDRFYHWDALLQQFSAPLVYADAAAWQPAEPSVMVGEGFLVFRNPALASPEKCWVRHFTIGPAAPPGTLIARPVSSSPRIQRVTFPAGQVALNILNPSGEAYDIEFSGDGLVWGTLARNQSIAQWAGPFTPAAQGYFRLAHASY